MCLGEGGTAKVKWRKFKVKRLHGGPGANVVLDVAKGSRRNGGNRAKTHMIFKIPKLHVRKAGAPGV